jgi:hypothetical protein
VGRGREEHWREGGVAKKRVHFFSEISSQNSVFCAAGIYLLNKIRPYLRRSFQFFSYSSQLMFPFSTRRRFENECNTPIRASTGATLASVDFSFATRSL